MRRTRFVGFGSNAVAAIRGRFKGEKGLLQAVRQGRAGSVAALLKSKVDVSVRDEIESATALHLAARSGHSEIMQMLIAAGIDVNAKTTFRETALHFAVANGHVKAVQV